MRLNNEQFIKIKQGTKTIELRLYDVKRKALRVGDLIEFTNRATNEKIDTIVTKLDRYKDFKELYPNYSKEELGYNKNANANPNDMLAYYSEEEITKYGVIAISIKLK